MDVAAPPVDTAPETEPQQDIHLTMPSGGTPPPAPPAQASQARPLTPDELSSLGTGPPTAKPSPNARPLSKDELDQINPADAMVRSLASQVQQKGKDYFGDLVTGMAEMGGALAFPEIFGPEAAATELAPWLRQPLTMLGRTLTRGALAGTGAAVAGQSARTVTGGAPPSVGEAAQEATQYGIGEAVAPAVVGGTRAALGKFLSLTGLNTRFPSLAAPFARTSAQYLENTYGGQPLSGVTPTPAQAHPGVFRRIGEAVSRMSLFGSQPFDATDAGNLRVIEQHAEDLVNQYGPKTSAEEAGNVIKGKQAAGVTPPAGTVAGARTPPDLTAAQGQSVIAAQQARDAAARAGSTRAGLARQSSTVGPEATGHLFQVAAGQAEDAARQTGNQLYADVDKAAEGIKVPLGPAADTANQFLTSQGDLVSTIRGGKAVGTARTVAGGVEPPPMPEGADTALSALSHLNADDPRAQALVSALHAAGVTPEDLETGSITFSQAHQLRSTLGQLQTAAFRSADNGIPGAAVNARFFGALRNTVDQSMTEAAGGTDSPLRQAYDQATAHWRDVVSAYSNGILSKAISTEPRLVTKTLIRPGAEADITALWSKVSPEAKAAVQAQVLRDLLYAKDGVTPLTAKQVMGNLQKMPVATLGALFDRPTVQQLTDLAPQLQEAMDREGAATAAQASLGKATAAADKDAASMEAGLKAHAASLARIHAPSPVDVFARSIKAGDVGSVDKLRTLVGAQDWNKILSAHAQELLFTPTGALKSSTTMANDLGTLSRPVLDAMYGKGAADQFHAIQRSLAMIGGAPSARMKLAMYTGQGAATFQLLRMPFTGTEHAAGAAAILLGPAIMGRILNNPAARAWLTTGLEAKAAGNLGLTGRMASQLATWLAREGLAGGSPTPGAPPPPTPSGLGGRAGGPPPAVGRGGS